jgi:hypothetical protein
MRGVKPFILCSPPEPFGLAAGLAKIRAPVPRDNRHRSHRHGCAGDLSAQQQRQGGRRRVLGESTYVFASLCVGRYFWLVGRPVFRPALRIATHGTPLVRFQSKTMHRSILVWQAGQSAAAAVLTAQHTRRRFGEPRHRAKQLQDGSAAIGSRQSLHKRRGSLERLPAPKDRVSDCGHAQEDI